MTAPLPEGLVDLAFTSEQSSSADLSFEVSNSDVIHKFWKVFDAQSNVTSDHASPRVRNLFWRIWSSPKLCQSIKSDLLLRLWRQCSEDFVLHPVGALPPLHQRSSQPQDAHTRGPERLRLSSLSPISRVSLVSDTSTPSAWSVGAPLRDPSLRATSPSTSREDHGASRDRGEETGLSPNPGTSTASVPAIAAGSDIPPSSSRATSSGRARPPVQVTPAKSRARPHAPRRKSSTPKSPLGPSTEQSPKCGLEEGSGALNSGGAPAGPYPHARGPPPGLPPVPAMTGDSGFALPSASSWQSVDSMNEHPMSMGTAASPPGPSGLVDRDFRGRFVETQKKLASSTNLAALGRIKKTGSVVRFADEIPHDLRKGKEKEILPDDSAGPSRLKSSLSSRVHANDDDCHAENVGLPRTKSQLSLLIRQERDATGSHDLGPGAGPTGRNVKSKGKEKENTRSNEQELLSMGQQGGVTKAGGVQVPEQQRLSEHHDPRYESSSSPEPLF